MVNMVQQSIAEVLMSMSKHNQAKHSKFIVINYEAKFAVSEEGKVISLYEKETESTRSDSVAEIANELSFYFRDELGIEFMKFDPLIYSSLLVTKDFVDKLMSPNSEINIGHLVYQYYNLWYLQKAGTDPNRITDNIGNFSRSELHLIDNDLIPIAIAPQTRHRNEIFRRAIESAIEGSPLSQFIHVQVAHDVIGRVVQGSKSWWIPRSVAQAYLQEDDIKQVRSLFVLEKLLSEAGLMSDPVSTSEDSSYLLEKYFNKEESKSRVENLVIEQTLNAPLFLQSRTQSNVNTENKEQFEITLTEELKRELISSDIETDDTEKLIREKVNYNDLL